MLLKKSYKLSRRYSIWFKRVQNKGCRDICALHGQPDCTYLYVHACMHMLRKFNSSGINYRYIPDDPKEKEDL